MAAKIPASMAFEQCVVLPLCTVTAAHGLFDADKLNLELPTLNATQRDEVVLVWGGSSSVGCGAIQLLRCAGYEVIATASKRNHGLVQSLGASVVDYNSPNVVEELVQALASPSKRFAAVFDCISDPAPGSTIQTIISVLKAVPGAPKKIGIVKPRLPKEMDGFSLHAMFATSNFANENAAKAWKFVPLALEKGLIKPLPAPEVVGQGLESIQKAVDVMRSGVSAKKLVVVL